MMILLLLLPLVLGGCIASNFAQVVEAVSKSQADVCVAVSTPYGGGVVGRANSKGSKLNMSGGQCSIEILPEPK
jgi:hypothetical protein